MTGRTVCILMITLICCASCSATSHSDDKKYIIDNSPGIGRRFDGIGGISGGGATSKLLVNYPEPQRSQILDYLFKPNFGASLQILKVEIGGDSQSTDGTESSHMHAADDLNLDRGYEWWMMKEAKQRNPDIKLYGLPWVFPGWLGGKDFNPFSSRENTLLYFMNWITGADKHHGLTIDYIGIWNERPYDIEFIKMLRNALDTSGYGHVQIVAADGEWGILKDFFSDPDLAQAISVIGVHYPGSESPDGALKADRPLWASEEYSAYNDLSGGGCWARVLNEGYVRGFLTSNIAWNLISSYYSALPYPNDGLMTAKEPWSGHYEVKSPIWMTAHHTQFYSIGWHYLIHGFGVGNLTGNGTYISLVDPEQTSLVIVIETMDPHDAPCFYSMPKYTVAEKQNATFVFKGNFGKYMEGLHIWYSKFDYSKGTATLLKYLGYFQPTNGSYTMELERNTVYTITTMNTTGNKGDYGPSPPSKPFPLPYMDNFEGYKPPQEPYNLAQQAGVWEVVNSGDSNHGNVIRQMVPQPPVDTCRPVRMTRPINEFGNFSWADTYYSLDVYVPREGNGTSGAYIAARVTSGNCPASFSDGIYFWVFMDLQKFVVSGNQTRSVIYESSHYPLHFDTWYTLALNIQGSHVQAMIDHQLVFSKTLKMPSSHGFMAFGTETYGTALFDNLAVTHPKT